MWNENKDYTTLDIAKCLNLSQSTIERYLHRGSDAGLCEYSCDKGKKRGNNKNFGESNTRSKKVFYNDIIYCSIREFANSIGIYEGKVRSWLVGELQPINENSMYSTAHFATEEEIKKYPKYN